MRRLFFLVATMAALAGGSGAAAQTSAGPAPAVHFGAMIGGKEGIADGESGNTLGITLNNFLFPSRPIPYSNGNIIADTLTNIGRGQSVRQAFTNAAEQDSGAVPSSEPPPGVGIGGSAITQSLETGIDIEKRYIVGPSPFVGIPCAPPECSVATPANVAPMPAPNFMFNVPMGGNRAGALVKGAPTAAPPSGAGVAK